VSEDTTVTPPKSKVVAGAARTPPAPKAAKFVIVCSKLPHDLELQLQKLETAEVPGRHGPVPQTSARRFGPIYIARGTAYPAGQVPEGYPNRPDKANGYACTYNIPVDFWREWVAQNAETEMVANRVIYAEEDLDAACEVAKENTDVDSGLGPLNPKGDRRDPKPINGAVSKIQPADRQAAA
jgi:hypothetical protein